MKGFVQDFALSASAKEDLEDRFENGPYRGAALERLREKACKAPDLPDRSNQKFLREFDYYRRPCRGNAQQWWLPWVCRLRSKLHSSIIVFGEGDAAGVLPACLRKRSTQDNNASQKSLLHDCLANAISRESMHFGGEVAPLT